MQMTPNTPQRAAIVIEQNKAGTWGVAAYLVTAGGRRYRRRLATCPTYEAAAQKLKLVWEKIEELDEAKD